MSTQELVYNLPKLGRRSLKRKMNAAKLKAKRYTKAQIRKARSKSIAYWRRQYFLTTARADLKVSVSRNEDIFIAATIIGLLIGYCFTSQVTNFLLLFFQTAIEAADATGASMIFLAAAAIGSLTVVLAWVAAFMMNTQAIAIMEGANGKQIRSIRKTVRMGLRNASRIASVWALMLGIVSAPLLLAAITAYTYISVADMSVKEVQAMLPQFIAGATAIVLLTLLQYSLAPYVALFEPELPLRDTLKRARLLVRRRGRIFLFALYISLAIVLAGIYGIGLLVQNVIGLTAIVTWSLGGLLALTTVNGILVMLYRKRKLARKY